jgi:chromosome segregation ATPase
LNALYHLQVYHSQATAQLIDQAQVFHQTIQLRDEQLREASAELESRGTRISQLEGQVQELQDTIADRNAMIQFLEDQLFDLELDLNDAQGQLHMQQHAQDALHAPPDEMQMDGEDEP